VHACIGGLARLDVVIEVVGPEEERIRAIDLKVPCQKFWNFAKKKAAR
jgi:hypothetical protein